MNATDTQNYIEVLEKTNQQLSLWYNPYGLMVAILTGLIAILAILFAYILWRQGAEYKKAFKDFLDEQRKIAEGEIKKSIDKSKTELDKLIDGTNDKLKDLGGEAKKEVEKQISELKKVRRSLDQSASMVSGFTGTTYAVPNVPTYTPWVHNVAGSSHTFETLHNPFQVQPSVHQCGFCGQAVNLADQFCSSCGNPQG